MVAMLGAAVDGTAAVGPDLGLAPRAYTVALAVLLVVGAFSLPRRARGVLAVVAVAAWGGVLVAAGGTGPAVLATQIVGGGLLAAVALRTAATLERATAVEQAASRASAQRTAVLEAVLQLHSLDHDDVLGPVVDGARALGFDSAVLRVVGPDGMRLAAARPAPAEAPPEVIALDEGVVGVAHREGRTLVLDDHAAHPAAAAIVPSLRGTIAAPIVADGEVVGVLLARRRARGVTRDQLRAVSELVAGTGTALARARRYADRSAAVAELRRLDDLTQDLVATVSHELRTPTTVVSGLGATLDERWDDLAPERRSDLLRRLVENAERLGTMVRSLLDTSAFERGRIEVRTVDVAVGEVVEGVRRRLAPLFEGHVLDVAVDHAVRGDPDLLTHVIENLLVNAVRHTPTGTHVTVTTARDETGSVEVVVADDGPGIPADDLPHVRERFYRGGEPGTRSRGGLGLGLALTQQLLAAHGSDLRVTSTEGEGATFSFRLDAAARPGRG